MYTVNSSEPNFNSSIFLPYTNIEEDGIEMYVTYSENSILYIDEQWFKTKSMLIENTNDKKQFLVIDDIVTDYYKLHWRYANTGTILSDGSQIKLNILTSKGSSGAANSSFAMENNPIFKFVEINELLVTGVDSEDKESVKINAPRFNNTANRLGYKSRLFSYVRKKTRS